MSVVQKAAVDELEIPTDILDILEELELPVSQVLTEVDGEFQVDEDAVAELRRRARVGFEDEIPPVLSNFVTAADLAAEDESDSADGEDFGDEGDLVPDLTLADFNFEALIADLNLADSAGALEDILALQPAYVKAARREGKRSPAAEFYNEVNRPLFRLRRRFQEAAQEAETVPFHERTTAQRLQAARGRRNIEYITELIIRFNDGLTRQYVRLFTSNTSQEDSADFQGAALVGLMGAIESFNPDLGKFGSWAYKRIQREVLRAVRQADHKSMNHGDFERRPEILRAHAKLAGPSGERNPSYEEVAAEVGCTVALVQRVLGAPRLDSIHMLVGPEGDTELGDLIPDSGPMVDDQALSGMDVEALAKYGLPVLDARERWVISRRFGLDGEPVQCLQSIGKQLKLSREAVRQIEGKALARLLHPATLSRIVRHGRV